MSIVGTGVLGLPFAFKIAGWLAGSIGVVVAGVSTYYCMIILVSSIFFFFWVLFFPPPKKFTLLLLLARDFHLFMGSHCLIAKLAAVFDLYSLPAALLVFVFNSARKFGILTSNLLTEIGCEFKVPGNTRKDLLTMIKNFGK